MSELARLVEERLGLRDGIVRELRAGELLVDAKTRDLRALANGAVRQLDARLLSIFASDERASHGQFTIQHVWWLPALRALLRLSSGIDPALPSFPSIAAKHPAANWFEREAMDLFGLSAQGHPNPGRVALHDDWPPGVYALRKDFPDDAVVARVAGDFHPFRPVSGEGVFQVPVGPVHAGVIEPGHFRFGVAGEPVLYLQMRLFYVHKGIEKRFERLPWRHGVFLAESISGDTAVGHALAFAHAIERLASIEVPARARALRVILLELERIYNHVADIGALATDVAFTVPASRAQSLREGLVRLHERLFGTRLLRGTIALGGVKTDLSDAGRQELLAHLAVLEPEFDHLITTLIDAGTFTDRVDATGVLTHQAARDLGIVGVAARASHVDGDLRRDLPHDAYEGLQFEVPLEDGGDVRARLMVRAREVEQSFRIVRQVIESLPATPLRAMLPPDLPPQSSALGWVEAWRGPILHYVATGDQGQIARVKVNDPSFLNWPGLIQAVPGNIVPDFPVINKSFNLSYSGNDR